MIDAGEVGADGGGRGDRELGQSPRRSGPDSGSGAAPRLTLVIQSAPRRLIMATTRPAQTKTRKSRKGGPCRST